MSYAVCAGVQGLLGTFGALLGAYTLWYLPLHVDLISVLRGTSLVVSGTTALALALGADRSHDSIDTVAFLTVLLEAVGAAWGLVLRLFMKARSVWHHYRQHGAAQIHVLDVIEMEQFLLEHNGEPQPYVRPHRLPVV